jgi:hypothetical protein
MNWTVSLKLSCLIQPSGWAERSKSALQIIYYPLFANLIFLQAANKCVVSGVGLTFLALFHQSFYPSSVQMPVWNIFSNAQVHDKK